MNTLEISIINSIFCNNTWNFVQYLKLSYNTRLFIENTAEYIVTNNIKIDNEKLKILNKIIKRKKDLTFNVLNRMRIHLTKDSWYDIFNLPEELLGINFEKIWNLHPLEYQKIHIYGKDVNMPRYQQNYSIPYKFSGVLHSAVPLPEILLPLCDYVDHLDYGEFNQRLINWYENGHHYISAHADDEKQIIKNTPIVSISLGATRTFRIREKTTKKIIKDILLPNGTVLVMGGNFQTEFTHEIPKIAGQKGSNIGARINITFRQIKI